MENNFAKNLKNIRELKKISQLDLAKKVNVDRSTISYWESGKADPTMGNVVKVAEALDVDIITLIAGNINNNSNELSDVIKIPIYSSIKSDIPINQNIIIDYITIPKTWIKNDKNFFAIKILDNSMSPNYNKDDIVIFEENNTLEFSNKKDCLVTISKNDAIFRNISINEDGINLIPLNLNNKEGYLPTFYSNKQINDLPVKIIGIIKERRTLF